MKSCLAEPFDAAKTSFEVMANIKSYLQYLLSRNNTLDIKSYLMVPLIVNPPFKVTIDAKSYSQHLLSCKLFA